MLNFPLEGKNTALLFKFVGNAKVNSLTQSHVVGVYTTTASTTPYGSLRFRTTPMTPYDPCHSNPFQLHCLCLPTSYQLPSNSPRLLPRHPSKGVETLDLSESRLRAIDIFKVKCHTLTLSRSQVLLIF